MTTETTCLRACGRPVDLRQPHVTVVRNVEQWDRHGNECTVARSTEIAAFHVECAPTGDDVLDGLVELGHVPAGSQT